MASATQEVALQGVAAASILPAELQPAVLAVVALHVVISVHGHHTDGCLTALCREDRTGTGGTFWCKNRVIISDTVDVVLHVHSEGHPIQALIAYRASEAAWVVGLPKGLQDHLHDEVSTHATLVSRLLEPGVQEVLLAVHFLTHVVECLPTKSSPTGVAGEAISMI